MSSHISSFEQAVFQTLVPQLEAEGFSVFVHPSKEMLPSFFSSFRPGAIAYRGDKKIAIEVTAEAPEGAPQLKHRGEIFSNHPEWELRLVYAPIWEMRDTIPASSKDLIEDHVRRIEASIEAMGPNAALLMAWGIFEAAARQLIPAGLAQPQDPSRLIEILASEGYATPDEADTLRALSHIRNGIAHGRLETTATSGQVADLIALTRVVLGIDG